MATLREHIPTRTALEQRLREKFSEQLTHFVVNTRGRRARFIRSRLYAIVSFCFMVAVVISLFAFSVLYPWPMRIALYSVLFIWTAGVISYGRRWFENDALLAREMNMAMVPIIMHTLDRTAIYSHNELHRKDAAQLLERAQLLPLENATVVADDLYSFFNPSMTVSQLVVRANDNPKAITFSGLLVTASLTRSQTGQLMISVAPATAPAELKLLTAGEFSSVPLQIPADLAVSAHATSTALSSAILSDEFLAEVYDWVRASGSPIQVAVRDNMIFILVAGASMLVSGGTSSTSEVKLRPVALRVVEPLWRAVRLIEGVRV